MLANASANVLAAHNTPAAQPVGVARATATRARVANPRVNGDSREMARGESEEVNHSSAPIARQRGMSNKTKTIATIGGGAALGAIIGGIAGHGKGAAIGAILGGGGGTLYSVIRNKQHQPIW